MSVQLSNACSTCSCDLKQKICIKRPLNININVKKFDQQKLETTACKSVNDHS